jgi:hypothetical protein
MRRHNSGTGQPKLPTRCSERFCPGLYQTFKLGGCRHVVPSCTRSSRGVVVRPVSNLVSIGVPALSARGHLRRSGTRDQGWVANMRHCPCPAGEHDDGRTWRRRLSAQPGRGPSPVTHCLVDESPKGSRQWVGRLELHVACLRRLRSGAYRWSHLWVLGTFSDRSCPLLSAVRRSAADPARTEGDPSLGAVLHVTKITPHLCQCA